MMNIYEIVILMLPLLLMLSLSLKLYIVVDVVKSLMSYVVVDKLLIHAYS